GGVDKEGGAAADLVAQKRDTGTRVLERFHHHIFQFVAKILLNGAFVLFGDFGVIGQDAHRAEVSFAAALVGREEFLHGVGGVGAVVQNLRKRGVTGANAGQRIAQGFGLFAALGALRAQGMELGLEFNALLLEGIELAAGGFEHMRRILGIAAQANGEFEQFMLAGLGFAQRFALIEQGLFGLLLFAVQAQQAFAGLGSGFAQGFD